MKKIWNTKKLGLLANFKNGLNFSKKNFGKGMKVIGVKDFQDYSFPKYDTLDEINPEGVVKQADLLEEEDILFVRSNGNRELIGRTLFITNLKEKISHSGFTIRARFFSDEVHVPFYSYLFKSKLVRSLLTAYGGGTNINNLNQQILYNLQVPVPSIQVQKRIADILFTYDDLIENNKKRIKILEEMAQNLYREWFVKLRFPIYRSDGTIERIHNPETDQMKDSHLGKIPKDWEVNILEDFGKIITGKTPSKKKKEYYGNYMPFVKTPDMHNCPFVSNSEEYLSELGANSQRLKTLPKNTILTSCIGTPGIVSITSVSCQTNQQINALIPYEIKNREYLFLSILGLKETMKQYGATGATMFNLSKGKFSLLKLLKPNSLFLINFNKHCKPIFDSIENLLIKNQNLIKQRNLLLPKLISGEIEV